MNRSSWIAVGLVVVAGLAIFGMFLTIPLHNGYIPQEKRAPLVVEETLP